MKITELKGIGEKYAQLLGRLSVYTVEDLVRLYPRDYIVYEEPVFINSLADCEKPVAAIEATVIASPKIYGNERKSILSVVVKDENLSVCGIIHFFLSLSSGLGCIIYSGAGLF